MKFDMHCHTKEGSIDAKVKIEDYVNKLKSLGYDGMLVTDHNSYKGYETWIKRIKESKIYNELYKDFTVLKGIEYDTQDAGHIIAVLPDGVHSKLLSIRGMKVEQLEKVVHDLGGILGPAHPYATGYFAIMNTRFGKYNEKILEKFDFIETFNSCTKPFANMKAKILAEKYKKPHFAGSDAHKENIIGTAFTEFEKEIKNNNDLINHIRKKAPTKADGKFIDKVLKEKNKFIEELGVVGYYIYNELGALFNSYFRKKEFAKCFNRYI